MNLKDLLPDISPELAVTYDIKIAVNWTKKKAKLVIVGYDNLVIAERELKTTTPPAEPTTGTQGDYWRRHHNPWLD